MNKENIKVAIVHDFLVSYGGAERVLEVLHEIFPEAPIYTLLYDEEKTKKRFENIKIKTSFLQKFPKFLKKRYRWLLPFMPVAIESLDLREYDVVISSSSAWSKGIVTRLSTKHVAFIHSPMRFVWDYNEKYLKENNKQNVFVRLLLSYFRVWDKQASERPDYLIANSLYTQKRIAKYYKRESEVIYPPIFLETEETFKNGERDYFLVVSRLSSYKKIDKIIEAFNDLKLPLLIVGEGKEEEKLKEMAQSNIKIVGWKSDEELAQIYSKARAFLFGSLDDFGLAPVEAMSLAVPVIAFSKGGALEYVDSGKTGEFFHFQNKEAIKKAVRKFIENEKKYDKEYIKQSVKKFSKDEFKEKIKNFINTIQKADDYRA